MVPCCCGDVVITTNVLTHFLVVIFYVFFFFLYFFCPFIRTRSRGSKRSRWRFGHERSRERHKPATGVSRLRSQRRLQVGTSLLWIPKAERAGVGERHDLVAFLCGGMRRGRGGVIKDLVNAMAVSEHFLVSLFRDCRDFYGHKAIAFILQMFDGDGFGSSEDDPDGGGWGGGGGGGGGYGSTAGARGGTNATPTPSFNYALAASGNSPSGTKPGRTPAPAMASDSDEFDYF